MRNWKTKQKNESLGKEKREKKKKKRMFVSDRGPASNQLKSVRWVIRAKALMNDYYNLIKKTEVTNFCCMCRNTGNSHVPFSPTPLVEVRGVSGLTYNSTPAGVIWRSFQKSAPILEMSFAKELTYTSTQSQVVVKKPYFRKNKWTSGVPFENARKEEQRTWPLGSYNRKRSGWKRYMFVSLILRCFILSSCLK